MNLKRTGGLSGFNPCIPSQWLVKPSIMTVSILQKPAAGISTGVAVELLLLYFLLAKYELKNILKSQYQCIVVQKSHVTLSIFKAHLILHLIKHYTVHWLPTSQRVQDCDKCSYYLSVCPSENRKGLLLIL